MKQIAHLSVCYSDVGDLELCATSRSMQEFAGCITACWSPIELIPLPSEQAVPYDGCLQVIDIGVKGDAVVVKREGLALTIRGSTEKLAILADNLHWLANKVTETGYDDHLHIEYYEGHYYLSAESEPLVVSLKA